MRARGVQKRKKHLQAKNSSYRILCMCYQALRIPAYRSTNHCKVGSLVYKDVQIEHDAKLTQRYLCWTLKIVTSICNVVRKHEHG